MIVDSKYPKDNITELNICHSKLSMTEYKALPSSRILLEKYQTPHLKSDTWISMLVYFSVLFKMAYSNLNATKEVTRLHLKLLFTTRINRICNWVVVAVINKSIPSLYSEENNYPAKTQACTFVYKKEFGGKALKIFQIYRKCNISW